jgi:hypothetical protein
MEPFRNNVNDNNFLYLSMGERVQLKKGIQIYYMFVSVCVYMYTVYVL